MLHRSLPLVILVTSIVLTSCAAQTLPPAARARPAESVYKRLIKDIGTSGDTNHAESNKDIGPAGDTGVYLARSADGATLIRPRPCVDPIVQSQELSFCSNAYLLKIGDVYTKGRSIESLRGLLTSPSAAKLQITIVSGDRKEQRQLCRYAKETINERSRQFADLLKMRDLFIGWYGSNSDVERTCKSMILSGNNFLVAPFFIAVIKPPQFITPSLADDCTESLPDALDVFYRNGMFDRFDEVTATCLTLSEKYSQKPVLGRLGWDASTLAKCSMMLSERGQAKAAQTICERLNQYLLRLPAHSRIHVLLCRAYLLEQSNPAKALELYNQLSTTCDLYSSPDSDDTVDVRGRIVSYFVKTKHWNMAIAEQLKVLKLRQKASGWMIYSAYQDHVRALVDLSSIYYQSGAIDKSIASLQEALSIYDRELNLDEQILLERSFTICPSYIRLKLANIYAASGMTGLAIKEIATAKKLVADALGEKSPSSIRIAEIQELISAQKSPLQNAKLSVAFSGIFGGDESLIKSATTNSTVYGATSSVVTGDCLWDTTSGTLVTACAGIDSSDQLARQAYDLAKSNPDKAYSIIKQILDLELAKKTLTADHVTRLINLTRFASKSGSKSRAIGILESLNRYLKRPVTETSANRLFVVAELAILAGSDKNTMTVPQNWQNLDELLTQMREQEFHYNSRGEDPTTIKMRTQQHLLNDLICLSQVYAFLDEPSKALTILNHAESRYPAACKQDIAPTTYKALLYVLLGKMDEAKKLIAKIQSADNWSGSDYSSMLGALCATLVQNEQTELSLDLLSLDASPVIAPVKDMLAYRRAIVHYQNRNYQQAMYEINSVGSSLPLSGNQWFNFYFFKAELLARTRRQDAAIEAFAKMQARGNLQMLVLRRAASLARNIAIVPQATAEALVDSVLRVRTTATEEYIEVARTILRLAKASSVSEDKLAGLRQRIADLGGVQNITAEDILETKHRAQQLEAQRSPGASGEWAKLARLYFAEQKYDQGTDTMLHALTPTAGVYCGVGMYHPANVRGDLGLDTLLNAKKYMSAEKILKTSLESTKCSSLPYTRSGFIEKSLLCELFIAQDNVVEAKKWADSLLATLSERDALCASETGRMRAYLLFTIIDKFIEKKQFDIANALLDGARMSLRKQVGPSSEFFIECHQSQSRLYLAQNRLGEAEASARSALQLETWLDGSRNIGKTSAGLLASVLRKSGRNAEADRLSLSDKPLKRTIPDQVKLYGFNMNGGHGYQECPYASTAEEPLRAMLAEAIEDHGAGSRTTRIARNNLTRFYIQQKRYQDAEKQQLITLETLDAQYGLCAAPKGACFLYLSEIYLAQMQLDNAAAFASAIASAPEIEDTYDLIGPRVRWAKILFAVGQSRRAVEIAREAEKSLLQIAPGYGSDDPEPNLRECLLIMQRAGASNDVAALKERLELITAGRVRKP